MPELDDSALLREFAKSCSESAFAAFVERHVNLVYSIALRSVGHSHAAEEIAHVVFIILARKARSLSKRTVLSGWLYRTTRLTAANYLRTEIRRQNREQEAYMQTILNEPAPEVWTQIAPLLDDAMERLGEKDRNAILLRFFGNKNLAEVGTALGASEDAAKMRVNRALDKLRKFFVKRGVDSTAAALAGTISVNSIQVAPVGLAKTISAAAVAKGAAATSSTLTLLKGALKIMAWTKAKTVIVAGAAAVLIVGTATPIAVHVVHQHQAANSIFSSKTELTDADNANYQRLTGTTPAQVAQTFFDLCAQGNWFEAGKYWQIDLPDSFKQHYGGLQIISIGKPFKATISIAGVAAAFPEEARRLKAAGIKRDFASPGVFVPYEMRLKDGTIRKWQLSIRCDNPEHRWYYDGGM